MDQKLSRHLLIVCFENYKVMHGEFNGLFFIEPVKNPG